MTRAHRRHPQIHTTVFTSTNTASVCNRIVVVRNYYVSEWGPDWCRQPYGFYRGSEFWEGFILGALAAHNYQSAPIYVMSPSTGYDGGPLQPPEGRDTFSDEVEALLGVLQVMSRACEVDPTAGLYEFREDFDPQADNPHISPERAYNCVRKGWPILFHPPGGSYEKIENLDDLRIYLYSRETRPIPGAE